MIFLFLAVELLIWIVIVGFNKRWRQIGIAVVVMSAVTFLVRMILAEHDPNMTLRVAPEIIAAIIRNVAFALLAHGIHCLINRSDTGLPR